METSFGGRKTVAGQRTATGKTILWTVIISLVQRCAERKEKKLTRRGMFLWYFWRLCVQPSVAVWFNICG